VDLADGVDLGVAVPAIDAALPPDALRHQAAARRGAAVLGRGDWPEAPCPSRAGPRRNAEAALRLASLAA